MWIFIYFSLNVDLLFKCSEKLKSQHWSVDLFSRNKLDRTIERLFQTIVFSLYHTIIIHLSTVINLQKKFKNFTKKH